MHFVDEVLQHFFRIGEIGDDAVFHRPHGSEVAGRPAEHFFRLRAHRDDHFAAPPGLVLTDTTDGSLSTMPFDLT